MATGVSGFLGTAAGGAVIASTMGAAGVGLSAPHVAHRIGTERLAERQAAAVQDTSIALALGTLNPSRSSSTSDGSCRSLPCQKIGDGRMPLSFAEGGFQKRKIKE